jgi:hypothetical protein
LSEENLRLLNTLLAIAALCLTCFGIGLAIGSLL